MTPAAFELGDEGPAVAGPQGEDGHALLLDDVHAFLEVGRQEDEVDGEGFVREGSVLVDLLTEQLAGHVARGDAAQAAGLAHGGGEHRLGDPCHTTCEYGVSDVEQAADGVLVHGGLS